MLLFSDTTTCTDSTLSKNTLLIAMLVFQFLAAAILSILEHHFGQLPDGSEMITGVAFLFLVFWWVVLDSRQRGFRRTRWFTIGVILLPIFVLPYYLVISRGREEYITIFIKTFSFAVGLLAAAQAGSLLIRYLS